jgi:hypothetical protein
MIPNHSAAFIPSSHKSKNSVAEQTGFLQSQKFTNNHYYFLVTAESATFQVLCRWTKPMSYCILPPLEVLPVPKNKTVD